jgi:hypothetical protein
MTPSPDAAPQQRRISARIGAQGAAVVSSEAIGDAPEDGTVAGASIVFDAAVVGNTANTRTLNLVNRGQDGTGGTVVATLALITGTNPAAMDEVAFVLSAVAGALNVNAGDVLAVQETVAGTGLANPGGEVKITLNRR